MKYLQTTSDIKGRLHKYKLSKTDSIMAIHEAIVNSIQAYANKIRVEIIREDDNLMLEENIKLKKIKKIMIVDDGEGFTENNYNSFKKIDSTYKFDQGGKGIGRLAWLKVFQKVEIISLFRDKTEIKKREISFSSEEGKEIGVGDVILSGEKELETKIILSDIQEDYYNGIPKKSETFSRKILNHCLIYFMTNADFDVKVIK